MWRLLPYPELYSLTIGPVLEKILENLILPVTILGHLLEENGFVVAGVVSFPIGRETCILI